MGVLYIPLLLGSLLLAQVLPESGVVSVPPNLSIPARLMKTIRADKVHRGDPVEFQTLEAVLVERDLVMPAGATLRGRIVGAASRQADKPSWVVLLVEEANWKQHALPLHAFISAQITISQRSQTPQSAENGAASTTNSRRVQRVSARAAAHEDENLTAVMGTPQDATVVAQDQVGSRPPVVKEIRIARDADGITYLFSQKSNLKLPEGAMFMLQNTVPKLHSAHAETSPK